jgi:DNA polymerase-3 subunit beta
MKIILDRQAALDALAPCVQVVPARSTMPILRNVLLTIGERRSKVNATDLEVWVEAELNGASSPSPVTLALPAKQLFETLSARKDEVISIEVSGTNAVISGKSWKFTVPTDDASKWPTAPEVGSIATATLLGDELALMLRRSSYAVECNAAASATHRILDGVNLEKVGETLHAVAFDMRRMASQGFDAEFGGSDWPTGSVVVPRKACDIWARAAASAGENPVMIGVDSGSARLVSEGVEVRTKLLHGVYPYRMTNFINAGEPIVTMSATAGELLEEVEAASITTSKESCGIYLSVADGKLRMSSEAAEQGGYEGEMELDTDGREGESRASSTFLADAIRRAGQSTLVNLTIREGGLMLATGDGMVACIAGMNLPGK